MRGKTDGIDSDLAGDHCDRHGGRCVGAETMSNGIDIGGDGELEYVDARLEAFAIGQQDRAEEWRQIEKLAQAMMLATMTSPRGVSPDWGTGDFVRWARAWIDDMKAERRKFLEEGDNA